MEKNTVTILSFIVGLIVSLLFGWGLIARALELRALGF